MEEQRPSLRSLNRSTSVKMFSSGTFSDQNDAARFKMQITDYAGKKYHSPIFTLSSKWRLLSHVISSENEGGRCVLFTLYRGDGTANSSHGREARLDVSCDIHSHDRKGMKYSFTPPITSGLQCIHKTREICLFPEYSASNTELSNAISIARLPGAKFFIRTGKESHQMGGNGRSAKMTKHALSLYACRNWGCGGSGRI